MWGDVGRYGEVAPAGKGSVVERRDASTPVPVGTRAGGGCVFQARGRRERELWREERRGREEASAVEARRALWKCLGSV